MAQPIRRIDSAAGILPDHEGGPFSSYEINPKGIRFGTQNPYEKVFVLIRPHILTNIGWMITAGAVFIVPFVVAYLIDTFGIPLGDFVSLERQLIVIVIYYSFLLTYVLFNFLDWYFDIYLVTNQRLIDYEFSPISSYHVIELALEDIQDIRDSTVGLLPSLFHYGTVIISSAAERGNFKFRAVPQPSRFRDVIGDLSSAVKTRGHEKFVRR
ncbi:PH domain-containing protein [Candidatus Dojkabacteria bacterium]|nr:PH domain-containing protein [Candidatus Dojkabacteria bacterium]